MIPRKPHHKGFRPRKPMKRAGKKTYKNIEINRELKRRFEELEIFTCELGYTGCMRNTMLSFAHAKRRRKFANENDWYQVILACTPCHQVLDYQHSHEETEQIVATIIANRSNHGVPTYE